MLAELLCERVLCSAELAGESTLRQELLHLLGVEGTC